MCFCLARVIVIGTRDYLKKSNFPPSKLIPGYRMVGIMAESSSYVVREFHEKCFDRTQFILRTVKASKTFLRSFSETSLKLC